MSEAFQIHIDRLRTGTTQKFDGMFGSSFLDIQEPDLLLAEAVTVKGEAYLTDDHLIIRLQAKTTFSMPCAVCNEMTGQVLKVDNFYHTVPIEEVPSAIYDFSADLREALLLELPKTIECNQGKCPERETLAPFFRSERRTENTTHFPFADLDDLK